MLEDYRKYLLGIRNNLIQCGVEFPVTPCMEYRELFELGCNLDSLLWFYSVLEISGSEDRLRGFFLPLGNHFKDKMKKAYYDEFQLFLKEYNKLSVRSYLSNPKYKNVTNISDIYGNAEENLVKLIDIGVEGSSSSDVRGLEYVECGRYLEDYDSSEKVENLDNNLNFVSSGRFVEGYTGDSVNVDFVGNGKFLEDYEVDEGGEEYEVGTDDWSEEESVEEESDWVEEPEEDYIEESDWTEESEEESDWIEKSEESDWVEESEEDYIEESEDYVEEDSDWVEEPEEESGESGESDWLEETEESDWIEEPEEGDSDWVEEPEEEESDWLEETEESDWVEEEESDWIEEPEIPNKNLEYKTEVVNSVQNQSNGVVKKKREKDISDHLQDFTNGFLTSSKRAIIKGLRKLDK